MNAISHVSTVTTKGQSEKAHRISYGLVSRICDALEEGGIHVKEVTLSGGEPLLHPEISRLVSRTAAFVPRVALVSNGLLATTSLLDDLARAGLSKIRLGVDSLDGRKPRPSPGTVDRNLDMDTLIQVANANGIIVELNVVITRFSRRHISAIVRYAVLNSLNVKFFEHVEVSSFGDDSRTGKISSQPHIALADFIAEASTIVDMPEPSTAPPFGKSNLIFSVEGVDLRYCRYLCPYQLCWTTGTRVDPLGYLYNCMLNRGIDRISLTSRSVGEDLDALGMASNRSCNARSGGG